MHAAPPVFERAQAYLDIQLNRPPGAGGRRFGAPPSPFVTISRESGSGGSSLAQLVATRLNQIQPAPADQPAWTVFDQEIVQQMLSSQELAPALARFLPENKLSELSSSVGEIVGLHPNLWDLVQRTNRFLRELAQRGRSIIVGRGGNFATAGIDGGVHVRLTAPADHRDRHMARHMQCSVREAMAHNRRVESARRAYVRSVFDRDVNDPLAYDVVINTARVTLDQAAEMVVALVSQRTPAPVAVAVV